VIFGGLATLSAALHSPDEFKVGHRSLYPDVMTSDWFFPAFALFLLSGLYIWTIGASVFGGSGGIRDLFRLPWLGYGVLLGGLQIAQIFFPIDRGFSPIFLLVTATLAVSLQLWRVAQPATRQDISINWSSLLPLGAIALLVFLPVFNTCTKPACYYDVGLYYLQKIRWLQTFPIVPGLGNLLLNLGYNQSAFLVTSFLDSLLPDRIGLWLVGGLLPWLGLTLSIYALIRLLSGRRAERRSSLELAYAVSLPAWIYTLLGNNISSGSPDVTSTCFIIHFFLTFAAFVMSPDPVEKARTFGDLWMLGAVCLCLKLSSLGVVAGIFFAVVLFLILEKNLSYWRRSIAIFGAAMAVCLIGFWAYRGILLTGYPLFPSRLMAAPVDWQIKPSATDRFREDVIYWSRIPYGDREMALEGFAWVAPWIKRVASLDLQFAWPIAIGLIGSATVLLLAWLEPRLRRGAYFWMLLSAPLLVHTIFWISTAPEPRYFGSAPWLFAAAPILGLIAAERSMAFVSALANLYLCAVPIAGLMVTTAWAWATPEVKFPEIPRPPMAEHANASGLLYYAPSEGNQSFDHTLPSSSGKLYDIELLDPALGMAGGFRSKQGRRQGE
jgi:hypothetical protein